MGWNFFPFFKVGWDDSIKKKGNYLSCVERKGALKIMIKVPTIQKSGLIWSLYKSVILSNPKFSSYSYISAMK